MKRVTRPDPLEAARKAVEVASDRQASDVVLLDLRSLAAFTDFFVICSAGSGRQISAITKAVDEALHQDGIRLNHTEGVEGSGWVLMDYGAIIVHVFSPEQRDHYDLESAWSKAPQLVRIQ